GRRGGELGVGGDGRALASADVIDELAHPRAEVDEARVRGHPALEEVHAQHAPEGVLRLAIGRAEATLVQLGDRPAGRLGCHAQRPPIVGDGGSARTLGARALEGKAGIAGPFGWNPFPGAATSARFMPSPASAAPERPGASGSWHPLVLVPVALAAWVYHPITRIYFFADDFILLASIASDRVAAFLLRPFGGHNRLGPCAAPTASAGTRSSSPRTTSSGSARICTTGACSSRTS